MDIRRKERVVNGLISVKAQDGQRQSNYRPKNTIVAEFNWIFDRTKKWLHDTIFLLGFISAYLLLSGQLPQDISKEIKDKYDAQMATSGVATPSGTVKPRSS